MCGLWGFVGDRPDLKFLADCRERAARRGPDGSSAVYSAGGAMTRLGGSWQSLQAARVVIGHCRLSTFGSAGVLQPLACGGGYLAHNGNLYNHRELAAAYALRPRTDCDSEVLGLLIDRFVDELGCLAAVTKALRLGGDTPSAVLACWPGCVFAKAAGQPLYAAGRPEGTYLCSIPGPAWLPVGEGSWTLPREDNGKEESTTARRPGVG